jgi:uncharacterized protein YbjT (DUF2867 family)
MSEVFVVMGASGHVGGEVTRRLLAGGKTVRAIARTADKLKALQVAEARAGSLGDRAFLTGALRGATAAFAMLPPDYTAADMHASQKAVAESIASSVRDAGVGHVVLLSSIGADLSAGTGPIAHLHAFEELLNGVPGLNVVHVRAAYFMENLLGNIGLIKSAGVNGGTIKADRRFPMVASRDIGAVVAEILAARAFNGRSVRYVLGPKDYSPAEATAVLGAAIGRPDLKYIEFPEADARQGMIGAGLSASVAHMFLEMNRALSSGLIKVEPRTPANTTPTTLEEFAKAVFAPAFAG